MCSIKPLVVIFLIALALTSCCNSETRTTPTKDLATTNLKPISKPTNLITHTEEQRNNGDIEKQLETIIAGDPKIDAANTIKSGHATLWSYNSRKGKIIPGIKDEDKVLVKNLELQTAPGMGDVVYGKKHQLLRQQFVQYASIFNQTILELSPK